MNILMLLFKDVQHDARVQREAQALAEVGHKVIIVCLHEYDAHVNDLHENITVIKLKLLTKDIKSKINNNEKPSLKGKLLFTIVRTPVIKITKDYYTYRIFYNKALEIIKKRKLSLSAIHCHDLNTLWQGVQLGKELNIPVVYDSHELFNEMAGRTKLERNIGYIVEGKFMKRVDHLIVVNEYVKDLFIDRYGDIPTTIVQNKPVFPERLIVQAERQNYWKEKFNLSEQDTILLYQGGVNPERGVEECIDALQYLHDDYKLIILGDGRLKPALIDYVNEKDLQNRVFFHDQVPAADILWYTKQADIGLVMYKNTSKNNFYSTPNKVFEYILAGIPVVTSNHPGKKYVVDKHQTGLCVEEQPKTIAEAIETINSNYNFYKENCLKNPFIYSWDSEKENVVNVYKNFKV